MECTVIDFLKPGRNNPKDAAISTGQVIVLDECDDGPQVFWRKGEDGVYYGYDVYGSEIAPLNYRQLTRDGWAKISPVSS